MPRCSIGARPIGDGAPCFVIAEAGVNHNGDLAMAERLVDAAAAAGADAVKFQTFAADRLVTAEAPKAAYQTRTTAQGESQAAMLRRLELSFEQHRHLMARCADRGILFLSSPFDELSADLLAEAGVEAFKIPSGEITNPPFLAHVARKGKPLIVSTGMSDLDEVDRAVRVIRAAAPVPFALLHCVSAYPAAAADINLRAMDTLRQCFAVPIGYSDHTVGTAVALAAVALGACVVEKHLTLDRTLPGPDHAASLEPDDFRQMVQGMREIEAALGDGIKRPVAAEADTARVARKSVVSAGPIRAGTIIQREMLAIKRPGTGIEPRDLDWVIGRTARVDIPADAPIGRDMV